MNRQYFRFDAEYNEIKKQLTISRGSVGNWDYETVCDFKKQTVLGWCYNPGMSASILFDEKALHPLELPLLWLQAVSEVDNAMCRHWQILHK